MSPEDIYTKFNINHLADFTRHTMHLHFLSVSDVVLHQDGGTKHYVAAVDYRVTYWYSI